MQSSSSAPATQSLSTAEVDKLMEEKKMIVERDLVLAAVETAEAKEATAAAAALQDKHCTSTCLVDGYIRKRTSTMMTQPIFDSGDETEDEDDVSHNTPKRLKLDPIKRKVYIAGKRRGMKYPLCPKGAMKVDLSSGLNKKYRLDLSPLACVHGRLVQGYACFENWWQSHKVFTSDHSSECAWWLDQTTARRYRPGTQHLEMKYMLFGDNFKYDSIVDARKFQYVRTYADFAASTDSYAELYQHKGDICIYDFDGPYADDGTPIVEEVNLKLLWGAINDPSIPFGHAYVLGAMLAGIPTGMYVHLKN